MTERINTLDGIFEEDHIPEMTQEKLPVAIQAYLAALIKSTPSFHQKFYAAPTNIAQSLARNWPPLPGHDEAKKRLFNILQTLLSKLPASEIVIDVAIAFHDSLVPILQEPDETAIALSLDADSGTIKILQLHDHDHTEPVQDLMVINGVTVIAQPAIKAQAWEWMDLPDLYGKKNNLTDRRQQDVLESYDAPVDPEFAFGVIIWQLMATNARVDFAQTGVLVNGQNRFLLRSADENITATFVRNAFVAKYSGFGSGDVYFNSLYSSPSVVQTLLPERTAQMTEHLTHDMHHHNDMHSAPEPE